MLSRLSRAGAGLQALSRARPGQGSMNSRSNEVGAISSYMIREGRNIFCSTTNATITGSDSNNKSEAKISVTFVCKDGEEKLVEVPIGMSMLDAAHENDIELEGACEGSLACSTCHVIVTLYSGCKLLQQIGGSCG